MSSPIFAGTAEYYSQYRPPYPDELLSDLVTHSVGTHGRHLVDLGCGTGEVALPLSAAFDSVTAIDMDPAMVALAERKSAEQKIDNVRWLVGPAEGLELADRSVDLVVAGSSFHWMDRALLSTRAYSWLVGTGVIAVLGGGSEVWDQKAQWQVVAVETIREYLGERRRAGNQAYGVNGQHSDFLVAAGFTMESRQYEVEKVWTADEIVGYLYSTSFASPVVLGDKKDPFEADLRRRLNDLSATDAFPETLKFYFMLGRK